MQQDVPTRNAPYVVLVGNCGAGKSTLVEKLTGVRGRSSRNSESFTKTSEYFWVRGKKLEIADTPGSNPIHEKVEHNMEIASALNYRPASKLLIVVKADVRKDEVISKISQYADRFVILPLNLVGVIVTNMDIEEREWSEAEFTQDCDNNLGIEDVVYSSPETTYGQLLKGILNICREPCDLNIDAEMFLKMFKITSNNRKILKVINDIVYKFELYKDQFDGQRAKFSPKEQVDLFFEYKAFMTKSAEEAKKEMANKLGFDFLDDNKSIEQAGYLALMMNQVRSILYDVRIEALKYQTNHNTTDLRKCPHCGFVWDKVQGCEGETRCGSLPSVHDHPKYSVMATFTFELRGTQFLISKTGDISLPQRTATAGGGCGRRIIWSEMQKIPTPRELEFVPGVINTNDVHSLPQQSHLTRRTMDTRLRRRPTGPRGVAPPVRPKPSFRS